MPKAMFVSSGLFYSSCSKATERGGKRLLLYFHKSVGKLLGSLLQQNEYMLLSADHLSPDYDRPQGTGVGFEFHLSFSDSLLTMTVPPPNLPAQSTGEADLLSTVGFILLSKLKAGFLLCSVLTCLKNVSLETIVIWNSVAAIMNALSVAVTSTGLRMRATR